MKLLYDNINQLYHVRDSSFRTILAFPEQGFMVKITFLKCTYLIMKSLSEQKNST